MELGSVNTATEALEVAPIWGPEIALVDLGLPDMSGDRVRRALLELLPDTKVLAVTAMNETTALGDHQGRVSRIHHQEHAATAVRCLDQTTLSGQMVIPHKLAAPPPARCLRRRVRPPY